MQTQQVAVKPCTIIQHIQLSLESISQDNSFESAIEVLENIAKECTGHDLIADIKMLQAEREEDENLGYWTVR